MKHLFTNETIEQKIIKIAEANQLYALQNHLLRGANDELHKKLKYRDDVTINKLRKENKKLKNSIHKAYTKYIMNITTTFTIAPNTVVTINGVPYVPQVVATKNFTNLVIVDASGSMGSKVPEVRGGLKNVFKDIKKESKENPDVLTTTIIVDFSGAGDVRELVNTTNSEDLTDTIADNYRTRGMTALYDAIEFAFSKVPAAQDGVFVTIITDGEENDSKLTSSEKVKELIQKSKDDKWVVTFMGTTDKCLDQAVSLGISRGNTMAFMDSGVGVTSAFTISNDERNTYYGTVTSGTLSTFDPNNVFTTSTKTLANNDYTTTTT